MQKLPTKESAILRKLEFCFILFYSYSKRSYLNEHVIKKKMYLKTIRKERLFIKTFENDSSLSKN